MDKWVKYLLVLFVLALIVSVLWPRNNFMGIKLNPFNQPYSEGFSKDDTRPTMAFFYAPWCGYCKKSKPEWEIFEKGNTNKDIYIVSIDCTLEENKEVAKLHGVTGYPTIKFCKNGLMNKDGVIDFDGDRTNVGFVSFLSEHYKK